MKKEIRTLARRIRDELALPTAARRIRAADRRGLPEKVPSSEAAIDAAVEWLCLAQDRSVPPDGGVARDFSLLSGWASSYPETTGYIVPTILDVAAERHDPALRERGRRMLDWLVSIQFPEGGFQGGKIDAVPRVPVTFNTGQILLGLARGALEFGDRYLEPMHRAAAWLVATQDRDGCWRSHPTPFAGPGEKAYETHVAWGLFEAARVAPDSDYGVAGLRNVQWALTKQQANGWFSDCCLKTPETPLTHTIGYVLRGVVEAWRFSGDERLLAAARRTADAIVKVTQPDGRLAGQWRRDWSPAADWVCLTGSVQIAHCLLLLFQGTGHPPYRDTATRLNAWVRRTMVLDGPEGVRGGIKGSFPVDGGYRRYEYVDWAAKFFVDSHRLERAVLGADETLQSAA